MSDTAREWVDRATLDCPHVEGGMCYSCEIASHDAYADEQTAALRAALRREHGHEQVPLPHDAGCGTCVLLADAEGQ